MDAKSNDPIYWPASEIARAIRERKISSSEIIDACLARIETVNPKLNAVVRLTAETARKEARAADAAIARGENKGPLHGVPITIKDAFETAGVISAGGTQGRANFVPERDATVVARMRAAGAIMLGKTNVPEFCLAYETNNIVYGRTNNPYDLSRTAGGSSGGEAAIIASGGSALGLGSDTGGSIRVPSHFSGIAGIRPTTGRAPRTGHWPPLNGIMDTLTQVGPMARYVEDLILALPIISGPDGRDPAIVPMTLGDPRAVNLKQIRAAFHTDNGIATPTPETAATVERAAKSLIDAGVNVDEVRPPGIEQAMDIFGHLNIAIFDCGVTALAEEAGTKEFGPLVKQGREGFKGQSISVAEICSLLTRLDEYRARMLSIFASRDVIICPVNAEPAMAHGATFGKIPAFSYTFAYNLTGWPGAVVRCGTSPEGLPIGVQVVARPWREDMALAVAAHLEGALGGWRRPPL
ncbi:MAG: amidase [Candidatus Binataceae bacterium]